MWLRRAFFSWLIPAVVVLPLWLIIGLFAFGGSGWAFLWVILLAIPSIVVGEILLTLAVRARGTVRAQRAVSWWDVLGIGVWHLLIVSLGFYQSSWWAFAFIAAIAVAVGLFWLEMWQLLREARPSNLIMHTTAGVAYVPPQATTAPDAAPDAAQKGVFVVQEKPTRPTV